MNTRNLILRSITLLCFLFTVGVGHTYAQGWERIFDAHPVPGNVDRAHALEQTLDGGYVIAGNSYDFNNIDEDILIIKTDAFGDTLWTTRYFDLLPDESYKGVQSIHQSADSSYMISGTYFHLTGSNGFDYYLMKLSKEGDSLWTKFYGTSEIETIRSTQQTADGGYILAGTTFHQFNSDQDIYLVKTNAVGDTLWTRAYGDPTRQEQGFAIQQTSDGGYIVAANLGLGNFPNYDTYLMKLDAFGDTLWTRTYGGASLAIEQTTDNGYVLSGTKNGQTHVLKTDVNGDSIWSKSYFSVIEKDFALSVQQTTDGGYIVAGGGDPTYLHTSGPYISQAYLLKLDVNGDSVWTQTYGGVTSRADVVEQTADGGYIFGGSIIVPSSGGATMYLVKTDSLGYSATNHIHGNVFQDDDLNCSLTLGESNLAGIPISAFQLGSGLTFYTTTDQFGDYHIDCGLGTYFVQAHPYTNYHTLTCIQSTIATFVNFYDVDTINFPLEPLAYCPLMHVNVSVPLLRQIDSSIYTIQYCNLGTADAQNVSVDVFMDAFLNLGDFTPTPSSQVGNIYTFNLGTVPIGQCGVISVPVIVDTSAILGQTHCVSAQITPDSICDPNPWVASRLIVEPFCQNDTAFFRIKNLASTPSTTRPFSVFEDDIVMRTGTVIIPGNFDTVIVIPAQPRRFYRLDVQQEPGFPPILGDSSASGFLEGCNPDASGAFNTGFVTQYPNGSSSPFSATDCQPNRGSFDPNNKIAQPFGYDANHFINSNQYIDYQINFQNTGTDTAFTVVLVDTLSEFLDPATIQVTVGSHPYTWQLKGNGILEVRFENILLPDSNVNEALSHGFIKFRIQQVPNNPIGTIINNFAGIYFDNNAPIRTNTTFHEIGLNYYTIDVIQIQQAPAIDVKVFPNPFQDFTTFQVTGQDFETLELYVYDMMGRLVDQKLNSFSNQIQLERNDLIQGIYVYQLMGDGQSISAGKIIVR